MFSFDRVVKAYAIEIFVETLFQTIRFPLLEFIKASNKLLCSTNLLECLMDEDPNFRILDEARVVCPLGAPLQHFPHSLPPSDV